MSKIIIYGLGGFCSDCSPTHDHPLHNVIEEIEVPDAAPVQEIESNETILLNKIAELENRLKSLESGNQ